MSKIIVQPGNPLDLTEEKLADLLEDIRSLGYQVEIKTVEQRGVGVTWWEVVYIFILTNVGGTLLNELTKIFIEWAKKRFEKEKPNNRPKSIDILGPDGKTLKSIVIYESGEIEDRTKDKQDFTPRQPPNS